MIRSWFTCCSVVIHPRFARNLLVMTTDSLGNCSWFARDLLVIQSLVTSDSLEIHAWFTRDSWLNHSWFNHDLIVIHSKFTRDSLVMIVQHLHACIYTNHTEDVWFDCACAESHVSNIIHWQHISVSPVHIYSCYYKREFDRSTHIADRAPAGCDVDAVCGVVAETCLRSALYSTDNNISIIYYDIMIDYRWIDELIYL